MQTDFRPATALLAFSTACGLFGGGAYAQVERIATCVASHHTASVQNRILDPDSTEVFAVRKVSVVCRALVDGRIVKRAEMTCPAKTTVSITVRWRKTVISGVCNQATDPPEETPQDAAGAQEKTE